MRNTRVIILLSPLGSWVPSLARRVIGNQWLLYRILLSLSPHIINAPNVPCPLKDLIQSEKPILRFIYRTPKVKNHFWITRFIINLTTRNSINKHKFISVSMGTSQISSSDWDMEISGSNLRGCKCLYPSLKARGICMTISPSETRRWIPSHGDKGLNLLWKSRYLYLRGRN
jgi:hypothetical protein